MLRNVGLPAKAVLLKFMTICGVTAVGLGEIAIFQGDANNVAAQQYGGTPPQRHLHLLSLKTRQRQVPLCHPLWAGLGLRLVERRPKNGGGRSLWWPLAEDGGRRLTKGVPGGEIRTFISTA